MWSLLTLTLLATTKSAAYCRDEIDNFTFFSQEIQSQKRTLAAQRQALAQRRTVLMRQKTAGLSAAARAKLSGQLSSYNRDVDSLNVQLNNYNKQVDIYNLRRIKIAKECLKVG